MIFKRQYPAPLPRTLQTRIRVVEKIRNDGTKTVEYYPEWSDILFGWSPINSNGIQSYIENDYSWGGLGTEAEAKKAIDSFIEVLLNEHRKATKKTIVTDIKYK